MPGTCDKNSEKGHLYARCHRLHNRSCEKRALLYLRELTDVLESSQVPEDLTESSHQRSSFLLRNRGEEKNCGKVLVG